MNLKKKAPKNHLIWFPFDLCTALSLPRFMIIAKILVLLIAIVIIIIILFHNGLGIMTALHNGAVFLCMQV